MNRNDINERLRKTNIKGKDYVEVNQRILAFWELYPNGRIETELIQDTGDRCTFKASVYDSDMLMATGHAFEFQSSGMVNKTSYVENCETSAVGRALGMLGIGITDALCSADEVQQAIEHQEKHEEPKKKNTPTEHKKKADDALGESQNRLVAAEKAYCNVMGINDWGEFHRTQVMTRSDYKNNVESLDAIADEFEQAVRGYECR